MFRPKEVLYIMKVDIIDIESVFRGLDATLVNRLNLQLVDLS